jgi:hypothetical protein
MGAHSPRLILVLSIAVTLLGPTAQGQTNQPADKGDGTPQAQPSPSPSTPDRPKDPAAGADAGPSKPSLADAARKARQKTQDQSGEKKPAAKPRVFTEGDFASSRNNPPRASKPAAKDAVTQGGSPSTTVKVIITDFKPEKPTIQRPGGSPVNWMIQNKSDHAVEIQATYLITGPCNYKWENSETMKLTAGQAYGDNMLAVAAFPESYCAGQYSMELRITSGSQVINSATATVTVL